MFILNIYIYIYLILPCFAARGPSLLGFQVLLKVRQLLLGLRPLPNARHGAAADILLLLAHTKTFAVPMNYATVVGDPVQVCWLLCIAVQCMFSRIMYPFFVDIFSFQLNSYIRGRFCFPSAAFWTMPRS